MDSALCRQPHVAPFSAGSCLATCAAAAVWSPAMRALAVIALVVVAAGVGDSLADEGLGTKVRYRDDKLTLRVDKMQVADILKEVARKSGAEIKGNVREPREISGQFDAVPLRDALPRLLGEQNFTLTYGEKGRLKTIELLGGPEEPLEPKQKAEAAAQAAAGDYDRRWIDVWKTFDHRSKVPVTGKLAELTGEDELNWDYVVNMAYGYEPDARVRSEAVTAGLKALENDPQLRDDVFARTSTMTDAELADFARTICKHNAEDFVKRVARLAERPEIKTRAVGVLRELRSQERRQAAGG
jgi:hypothetical protein